MEIKGIDVSAWNGTWYYVFASFLAAFIVYLVSTGGWEKIKEIWDRTKYKDSEGE